jgi:hypothetical protein
VRHHGLVVLDPDHRLARAHQPVEQRSRFMLPATPTSREAELQH